MQVTFLFSFNLMHGKQFAAVHSTVLTMYALVDKLLEWHPDMDGAGVALLHCDSMHSIS